MTSDHLVRSKSVANLRTRLETGLLAVIIALAGCGKSKPMTPAQQGRIVYMTNCVVCHNADPNLPGSQGPPIAGSSRELVYLRVTSLKYPPGYKPKRTTHAMRAMPQLANQVDNLTAFLDEAAKQQK
jgi:mono/diheme cytochrome c family protein